MKKIITFFIITFFFQGFLFSQDISVKYAEMISSTNLRKYLSILASEEMEGRRIRTIGIERAAEYIKNQFREMGVPPPFSLPDYQQNFIFSRDTIMPESFSIGKSHFNFGEQYFIGRGTAKENEFKAKEIIFAGYGISDKNYDDYADKEVKGKVVIIFQGEPKAKDNFIVGGSETPSRWSSGILDKINIAKEKGAEAIFIVSSSDHLATKPNSSNLLFPENSEVKDLPVIFIIPKMLEDIFGKKEAAEIINKQQSASSLKEIQLNKTAKIKLKYGTVSLNAPTGNIIGMIQGSDKPDEYVFITAHYDHLGKSANAIYYGADDNASGTSALLEMAHIFIKAKENGNGPRRTIVFIAFSAEEAGLLGSSYYVSNPVFPLKNTSVDLNIDMIGRLDRDRNPNYIYVIGNKKLSSDLTPLVFLANEKLPQLKLDYKYNDPDDQEKVFYRSDHYNFAKNGVPIMFFFDGIHGDYHKPTDTVDKINFDVMEKRTQLIFLIAWEIANRDEMLKRDIPFIPDPEFN